MGQTLTHGVYLPDEGERNCYNGLAANWSILDNSVGTIAEHTTALAGKAPAVHTHTKADITDFPAYGNTAGTICEGNDSRLSDARTPVAHTHTKSDVTDLLNSNFIPSANNSYDLGSSSYQWNNLYAKNYYYNGVAWGLDKANVWSQNQSIANAVTPKFILQDTRNDRTYSASTTLSGGVMRWECDDKDGAPLSRISTTLRSDKVVQLQLAIFNEDSTGTEFNRAIRFAVGNTGSTGYYPEQTGNVELGTSTNKWKSLNGTNPGALSLPGAYKGINDQIKNPSDQLNAIDLNGGNNTWVSDVDCYLYFYIPNNKFTWIRIFWPATLVRCGQTFVPVPNESSDYSGFVPVPANTTVVIQIKGTQAPIFRRSACLGNV